MQPLKQDTPGKYGTYRIGERLRVKGLARDFRIMIKRFRHCEPSCREGVGEGCSGVYFVDEEERSWCPLEDDFERLSKRVEGRGKDV